MKAKHTPIPIQLINLFIPSSTLSSFTLSSIESLQIINDQAISTLLTFLSTEATPLELSVISTSLIMNFQSIPMNLHRFLSTTNDIHRLLYNLYMAHHCDSLLKLIELLITEGSSQHQGSFDWLYEDISRLIRTKQLKADFLCNFLKILKVFYAIPIKQSYFYAYENELGGFKLTMPQSKYLNEFIDESKGITVAIWFSKGVKNDEYKGEVMRMVYSDGNDNTDVSGIVSMEEDGDCYRFMLSIMKGIKVYECNYMMLSKENEKEMFYIVMAIEGNKHSVTLNITRSLYSQIYNNNNNNKEKGNQCSVTIPLNKEHNRIQIKYIKSMTFLHKTCGAIPSIVIYNTTVNHEYFNNITFIESYKDLLMPHNFKVIPSLVYLPSASGANTYNPSLHNHLYTLTYTTPYSNCATTATNILKYQYGPYHLLPLMEQVYLNRNNQEWQSYNFTKEIIEIGTELLSVAKGDADFFKLLSLFLERMPKAAIKEGLGNRIALLCFNQLKGVARREFIDNVMINERIIFAMGEEGIILGREEMKIKILRKALVYYDMMWEKECCCIEHQAKLIKQSHIVMKPNLIEKICKVIDAIKSRNEQKKEIMEYLLPLLYFNHSPCLTKHLLDICNTYFINGIDNIQLLSLIHHQCTITPWPEIKVKCFTIFLSVFNKQPRLPFFKHTPIGIIAIDHIIPTLIDTFTEQYITNNSNAMYSALLKWLLPVNSFSNNEIHSLASSSVIETHQELISLLMLLMNQLTKVYAVFNNAFHKKVNDMFLRELSCLDETIIASLGDAYRTTLMYKLTTIFYYNQSTIHIVYIHAMLIYYDLFTKKINEFDIAKFIRIIKDLLKSLPIDSKKPPTDIILQSIRIVVNSIHTEGKFEPKHLLDFIANCFRYVTNTNNLSDLTINECIQRFFKECIECLCPFWRKSCFKLAKMLDVQSEMEKHKKTLSKEKNYLKLEIDIFLYNDENTNNLPIMLSVMYSELIKERNDIRLLEDYQSFLFFLIILSMVKSHNSQCIADALTIGFRAMLCIENDSATQVMHRVMKVMMYYFDPKVYEKKWYQGLIVSKAKIGNSDTMTNMIGLFIAFDKEYFIDAFNHFKAGKEKYTDTEVFIGKFRAVIDLAYSTFINNYADYYKQLKELSTNIAKHSIPKDSNNSFLIESSMIIPITIDNFIIDYQRQCVKDINDAYRSDKDKRLLYKKVKKRLFSWNSAYSDKERFYVKREIETHKGIKLKVKNYYTKTMTKPFLVPVVNVEEYLPLFALFDKEKLFNEGDENKNGEERLYIGEILDEVDKEEKINNEEYIENDITINKELTMIETEINDNSSRTPDNRPTSTSLTDPLTLTLSSIIPKSPSSLSSSALAGTIPVAGIDTFIFPNLPIKHRQLHIFTHLTSSTILSSTPSSNCLMYLKSSDIPSLDTTDQFKDICCIVKPSRHIKGQFHLTTDCINFTIFFDKAIIMNLNEDKQLDYDSDKRTCFGSYLRPCPKDKDKTAYKFHIDSIIMVVQRKYYYKLTALEIMFSNHKVYYFNFLREQTMENVWKEMKNNPRLIKNKTIFIKYNPSKKHSLIESKKDDWRKGRITNMDFIMWVNFCGNRSYNDLSQYPIFPWIISDYNNTIDYRDLSLPMGMLSYDKYPKSLSRKTDYLKSFAIQTEEYNIDTGEEHKAKPYVFGSHYSNPIYVCHYLARLFPYSEVMIEMQGNRFDDPNRLFISIEATFESSCSHKGDVREMIPEFFYLPEMFINVNNFDFGVMRNKVKVDNVKCPSWADNNPFMFVTKMRRSIEEDKVSNGLNAWIDLIFGVKQKGQLAIDFNNVYMDVTYIDKEGINDNDDNCGLTYMMRMVEFGLCPRQVFNSLLNPKETIREIAKEKDIRRDSRGRISGNSNDSPVSTKTYIIPINKAMSMQRGKVVRILFSADKKLRIAYSNGTIDKYALCGNQYEEDSQFKRDYGLRKEEGFSQKMEIYYNNIDYTLPLIIFNQGKSFAQGALYDGSILFTDTNNNTTYTVNPNEQLSSPVIALIINNEETMIISGSLNGCITILQNDPQLIDNKFICSHSFFCHTAAITSLFISNELNVFATASKDGYVHLFTFPTVAMLRSIRLDNKDYADYVFLSESPLPAIVVYCSKKKEWQCFSVNGFSLIVVKETNGGLIYAKIIKDACGFDYIVCVMMDGSVALKAFPYMDEEYRIYGSGNGGRCYCDAINDMLAVYDAMKGIVVCYKELLSDDRKIRRWSK